MRPTTITAALAVTVALSGCDTDCNIGGLEGTWRWSYAEIDGTCGPIPSETIRADGHRQDPRCVEHSRHIAEDRCRLEIDWECPAEREGESERWVMVLTQTESDWIQGSGTLTVSDDGGTVCRSTYEVTIEQL